MASGGLAVRTQSFTPRPGAPKYLISALKDIGKDERKYRKYFNDEIKQWLGYDFDVAKDPWCAVWIGVELEEAGYTSTKKANARSYLTWGAATEENSWSEGDIVVLWRGQRDDGVFGHIGFLLNYDEDYVYLLGGNQGDKVCIQRFSRSKILDVRRPRNPWFTRTVKASAAQVAAGSAVVINETTKTVPVLILSSDELEI